MKTRVYIDGYNLYYGCLKNTPYKWLDIVKLFENHILPNSAPQRNMPSDLSFKYFTADIKEQAAFDPSSHSDQKAYHRALEATYTLEKLEIIKGYYSVADQQAFLIDETKPTRPPRECKKVNIWKLEEKQTDVNIAIHALKDVLTDDSIQQVVFVTNDTDLAPVVNMISDMKRVAIGIVIPINDKTVRRASTMLTKKSTWCRETIDSNSLKSSSLPRVISKSIRNKKMRKAIIKPNGWFGQAHTVEQILAVLGTVFSSPSDCWKWLETEKPKVEGLPELPCLPYLLLDERQGALNVLEHAQAYVRFKISPAH